MVRKLSEPIIRSCCKYVFHYYHTVPNTEPSINSVILTSTSVNVTWDPIACSERNGEITGYAVEFQEQRVRGEEVVNRSFTASGLRPYTNYTFRVAGVNINGTGPFSNTTIITTGEESV